MAIQNARPMIGYLATGILVLALLRFGQAIFVPLAFSLFVIALVGPLQIKLQRWMPQLLALLVTLSLQSSSSSPSDPR